MTRLGRTGGLAAGPSPSIDRATCNIGVHPEIGSARLVYLMFNYNELDVRAIIVALALWPEMKANDSRIGTAAVPL